MNAGDTVNLGGMPVRILEVNETVSPPIALVLSQVPQVRWVQLASLVPVPGSAAAPAGAESHPGVTSVPPPPPPVVTGQARLAVAPTKK